MIDKHQLDDENLAKIRREVHVMKRVTHPSIIRLYEVCKKITKHLLYDTSLISDKQFHIVILFWCMKL